MKCKQRWCSYRFGLGGIDKLYSHPVAPKAGATRTCPERSRRGGATSLPHSHYGQLLISRLRRGRLHIFHSYPCNAVAFHLFNNKFLAAVIAGVSNRGNLLQPRKHEASKGFKSGIPGE